MKFLDFTPAAEHSRAISSPACGPPLLLLVELDLGLLVMIAAHTNLRMNTHIIIVAEI